MRKCGMWEENGYRKDWELALDTDVVSSQSKQHCAKDDLYWVRRDDRVHWYAFEFLVKRVQSQLHVRFLLLYNRNRLFKIGKVQSVPEHTVSTFILCTVEFWMLF
jgi:hypothetical protein